MVRTCVRRVAWLMMCLSWLPLSLEAGNTLMVTGTWVSNLSVSVVSAEINGKTEIICLPRLEFKEPIDRQALAQKMKEGVKRQEAIFHLYHDGIATPIRKNNLLFSADVYLKEAKMTYIGLLREWGYGFKVIRKPPMDDPDYMQTIAAESMIGSLSATKKPATPKPASEGAAGIGQPGQKHPEGGSLSSSGGPLPSELLDIREKYSVMPAGVLHPSVRKEKQELEAKLKELKSRPYKSETPRVDPVRWASGKMGLIESNGTISQAVVEGQRISLQAIVPPKDWWKPTMRTALASQPCEFIFQRDNYGLEAIRDGKMMLADLYFSDLGQTWDEWLREQGSEPASMTSDPSWATGSVELKVRVAHGTWLELMAPSVAKIGFASPPAGLQSVELVRLPPHDFPIKDYRTFRAAVDNVLKQRPVAVSLLYCLNGKPYTELGQKRALRVYLPQTKETVQLLMQKVATGGR